MRNKEEAMNNKYTAIVAIFAMTSFALVGCGGHDTLNKNWGSSYKAAQQNQTANPDASKNLDPVVGLDGLSAEKAMEGYQQGSGDREKGTTYNLRLGTIEGIGEKK
jgi:hypothetical protein